MKHDCNMYIHPNQARGLTVREAARIQGFHANYVFCGKLGAMYRQIHTLYQSNHWQKLLHQQFVRKHSSSLVLDLCAGIGGFRAGCSL